jgi:hypothetical protein
MTTNLVLFIQLVIFFSTVEVNVDLLCSETILLVFGIHKCQTAKEMNINTKCLGFPNMFHMTTNFLPSRNHFVLRCALPI